MATVVGFVSEKGGVGKTTACYHIAVALRRYHTKKVLVVDTDYQHGGITCRFKPEMLVDFRSGEVKGATLFLQFQRLYSGQAPNGNVDLLDTDEGITLLPADPRLAQVTESKMPSSSTIREYNRRLLAHLSLVKDTLDPLIERFDYILIDSHPEISDLLRSVIYASHYCVSPVKLDMQSTVGVPSAQQAINGVNKDMEMISIALDSPPAYTPTKYAGAIAMMTTERSGGLIKSQKPQYRRLAQTGGAFDHYVTEGDGIRKAAARRCAVYDVNDTPNAERQAEQFREVTAEFLTKCP
jgi:chromosome partitioning protein